MDAERPIPRTSEVLDRERRARRLAEALSDRHARAQWRAQRELDAVERIMVAACGPHPPSDALEDALVAVAASGGWQGAQLWLVSRTAVGLPPLSTWLAREKDVRPDTRETLDRACGESKAFRQTLEQQVPVVVDLTTAAASVIGDEALPADAPALAVLVPLGEPSSEDVLVLYGDEPGEGREAACEAAARLAVHLGRAARHLLADAEREAHLGALRRRAAHLGAAVAEEETRADRASEAFLRGLIDLGSQLREPLSELLGALDRAAVAGLDDPARERVMVACAAAARLSGVLDDLADRAWDTARGRN